MATVTYPPLAPDALWCSYFLLKASKEELADSCIYYANQKGVSSRNFARFSLFDTHQNTVSLSIPVEGGAKKLRDFSTMHSLRLSEHGNWRKNHIGALETYLGKTPFFRDLEKELYEIYLNKEINSLDKFNSAIWDLIYSFLIGEINKFQLRLFYENKTLQERGKEIASKINPKISCLQYVATMGPESLLGFMSLNMGYNSGE